jgi:hypothetical protein
VRLDIFPSCCAAWSPLSGRESTYRAVQFWPATSYLTETFGYSQLVAARFEEAKAARTLVNELETLGDNWDGYGASPITPQTCTNARGLIDMIEASPHKVPIPEIAPTPSGTISFEWETDEVVLYLEVGNTRVSGYIKMDRNPPTYLHGRVHDLDQQSLTFVQTTIAAPENPSRSITAIYRQVPQHELVAA